MNTIPKTNLENQIGSCKLNNGLYHYNKHKNGIIISKSYKNINNQQYIIQHRLLKIDNDFYQIIDYYFENQQYPEITKISLEDFLNMNNETKFINNL